jgi:vacuolar-type H+-ATPase subunit E/Vma4
MEIKQLMQKMHDAQTEEEVEELKREIISRYTSLSDAEKEAVKKDFLDGLDKKLKEADQLMEKIDKTLTISEK